MPPYGQHLATIEPGTYLGPVEDWNQSDQFATICVRNWWINVWSAAGTYFAFPVPSIEVEGWHANGWSSS